MKNALIACGTMLLAASALSQNDRYPVDSYVDSSGTYVVLYETTNGTGPFEYGLAKYDIAGNVVFSGNYVTGNVQGRAVTVDGSGNIYVVGNKTPFFSSAQDYFIHKYDSSGNFQWEVMIDKGFNDVALDVKCDPSGNVYMVGGSVKSGPSYDGWIFKYNSSGVQQWERSDGTGNFCYFKNLLVDSSGNSFAIGIYNNGSNDTMRVEKRNSSGTTQYTKTGTGEYLNNSVYDNRTYVPLFDSNQDVYIVSSKVIATGPTRAQVVAHRIANSSGTQTNFSYSATASTHDRGYCARINSSNELFIGGNSYDGINDSSMVLKVNTSMALASDDFFSYGTVKGIELGSSLQGYLLLSNKVVSGINEIHLNNISYAGSLIGNTVFSAWTNDYVGFSDNGGGYKYFFGHGYAPGVSYTKVIVGHIDFGPNITNSYYLP